jgi:hypothetical protein
MVTTAMLRSSVLSKNRSPLAALRSICGEARKGALPRSVSDWVVRHARCPVLVVGAGARVADIASGALTGSPAGTLLTEALRNPYGR